MRRTSSFVPCGPKSERAGVRAELARDQSCRGQYASAEFVARNVGSAEVRTIQYCNSYHILTIDNEKQSVADETIGFFRGPAGAAMEYSEESGEGQKPKHLSVA